MFYVQEKKKTRAVKKVAAGIRMIPVLIERSITTAVVVYHKLETEGARPIARN